jgi:TRAP-type C4-dicarboxylate transport system permease small subunit
MTDQPLDDDFGGSGESYGDDLYLEGSDRAQTWLPSPTRDASAGFVLGILGFATCGLLSPLALYYSRRALREFEATGVSSEASERNARMGQLMGLVGTSLLVTGVALMLVFGLRAWDVLTDLDLPG